MTDNPPNHRTSHCERFARQNCFERLKSRKWDNLMNRRPQATGFYDDKTGDGVIYWEVSPLQGNIMEIEYHNGYLRLPPRRRHADDCQGSEEESHVD